MFDKAQLDIALDVSVGDWIRESLDPWVAFSEIQVTMGIVIPKGFESYVLVRHTGPGDHHGGLGNESLGTLVEILSNFTIAREECFFALWEGYGWMHPGSIAPSNLFDTQNFMGFFDQFRSGSALGGLEGEFGHKFNRWIT